MGFSELIRSIPNVHFKEDYPMNLHTGLAVGGKAKYFIAPETVNSVKIAINTAKQYDIPVKAIGNGTNLLVSDSGFEGMVISSKYLTSKLLDKGDIIALCGAQLSSFVRFSAGSGYTGMEGLFGIPATVGGAVYQNAGAFGYEISDYIVDVTVLIDGEIKRYSKKECGFKYRGSGFTKEEFIVSARFNFPKRRHAARRQEYYKYLSKREQIQPKGKSCGSVFKNPKGDHAARLIEGAGLKGFRVGGAAVSEMHANFILTEDGASAKDVYSVISEIKKRVFDKYGVILTEEVEYLGVFK